MNHHIQQARRRLNEAQKMMFLSSPSSPSSSSPPFHPILKVEETLKTNPSSSSPASARAPSDDAALLLSSSAPDLHDADEGGLSLTVNERALVVARHSGGPNDGSAALSVHRSISDGTRYNTRNSILSSASSSMASTAMGSTNEQSAIIENQSLKSEVEQLKEALKLTTSELSSTADSALKELRQERVLNQTLKKDIRELEQCLKQTETENEELYEDMMDAWKVTEEFQQKLSFKEEEMKVLSKQAMDLQKERDELAEELCTIHTGGDRELLKEKLQQMQRQSKRNLLELQKEKHELEERYDQVVRERDEMEHENTLLKQKLKEQKASASVKSHQRHHKSNKKQDLQRSSSDALLKQGVNKHKKTASTYSDIGNGVDDSSSSIGNRAANTQPHHPGHAKSATTRKMQRRASSTEGIIYDKKKSDVVMPTTAKGNRRQRFSLTGTTSPSLDKVLKDVAASLFNTQQSSSSNLSCQSDDEDEFEFEIKAPLTKMKRHTPLTSTISERRHESTVMDHAEPTNNFSSCTPQKKVPSLTISTADATSSIQSSTACTNQGFMKKAMDVFSTARGSASPSASASTSAHNSRTNLKQKRELSHSYHAADLTSYSNVTWHGQSTRSLYSSIPSVIAGDDTASILSAPPAAPPSLSRAATVPSHDAGQQPSSTRKSVDPRTTLLYPSLLYLTTPASDSSQVDKTNTPL